ncbi:hypothetical protein C5612_20680 [Pseudomonas frederiksbergensis]|uniref:Uncharacterized protein n=1 Tax=Pseudomonas frederiksbergensis TaxID=104087 RepID=A0A2S8HGH9_9PSED|nr:hypothetical protein C5612_20680 [Pseudomonas frederiksbergensis]
MWERACSRKRLNIQHLCCLTHRFREQARSHIGLHTPSIIAYSRDHETVGNTADITKVTDLEPCPLGQGFSGDRPFSLNF